VAVSAAAAIAGLLLLALMLDRVGASLATVLARLQAGTDRQRFGTELAEALDGVDSEAEAFDVIERAMGHAAGDRPMELLLAGQVGARLGTLRAFERSELQAGTDGLTGLINRRTMESRVRVLLQSHRSFSLVMADLDHFTRLNDTYGHAAGDRALRLFAHTVRGGIRGQDLFARYGGEEFTLVFPGATIAETVETLERQRAALALATGTGASAG
jgi:GAF domain-containing protein